MKNSEKFGFEIFGFNKQIETAIRDRGWDTPSPIQKKAIPLIKSGKDLLGIAQTGTGKSAAFLLPLISKLHYPQGENTRAIVLAPTKELVIQLGQHFEELNKNINLRSCLLVGGIGISGQLEILKKGNDIVFATPGRFREIYQTNEWKIKDIRTLVVDEADRMMDMGFMPQLRQILEVLPRKRQNLLFSATFPPSVETLAAEFLEFPERAEVTEQASVAATIEQQVYKTPNFQTKLNLLLHLLKNLKEDQTAMVFVKTRTHATEIGKFLSRKLEIKSGYLHANKGTNTRIAALQSLHQNEIQILVATDVAARGLDIPSVALVIHFDLPVKYEEYVHRSGRTGRASRTGKAIAFADPSEELHLTRIESMIKSKIPVQTVPANLIVSQTPFEENQTILRKIDEQKRKADPTFRGAFHEKKEKNKPSKPAAKSKSAKKSTGPNLAKKKTGKAFKKPRV
jgi:ATP-dependent RNA helicase RhlE